MRAISAFSREAGTSTLGCRAEMALRTRVSMSAIGSLIISVLLRLLPTGFDHSRDLAVERELPEAQAADPELAQKRARASAAPAAVTVLAAHLRLPALDRRLELKVFGDFRCGGHFLCLLTGGTACPSAAAAPNLRAPSSPV